MKNKDLRKLGRKDLLEIILEQTKRIEELENELENAKKELADKRVVLKETGSLAEASLKLSGIFKSIDEAAEIYMTNVKELARNEEKKMRKDAKEKIAKMIAKAEAKCKKQEVLNKKEPKNSKTGVSLDEKNKKGKAFSKKKELVHE